MEYTLKNIEDWNIKIEQIAKSFGLDYYEQEFEFVGYKDMLAYEAYLGMPSRYPHWSFGKAYEKSSTIYKYNLSGLPYEMVINSDPCIAYLMKENTLLLQILTIAHVYGHNDFFKNNRLFKEGTRASYTVEMFKAHADAVRRYINDPSIGYQKVERILDAAHAIKLQASRVIGEIRVSDEELKEKIIEDYVNSNQRKSIIEPYEEKKIMDLNKIPLEPEEDILLFIVKYGNLQEWEKNLLEIVRQETAYFIPQIETKIMNEGWASFWHYNTLKKLNLKDELYLEFIKRHNDVIAPGIGSINPYFIGFKIFSFLYEKYGIEKIFEVRKLDRDESFIRRYLTEDLCRELNLFKYAKEADKYVIKDVADKSGWINIRNTLSSSCGMGSVPVIKVVDMSSYDKSLIIEHVYDGRELNATYAEQTLKYIYELWGHRVVLKTKDEEGDINIICDEKDKIIRRRE
ncbi:stage V sporulation protein R [Clostridium acidisoli DSM 12555]|uniref:Stage V sporulation protein R n=1 Tax=Clostridium acidisoli DSM 12555 TaxID=1121291 RepID=A0A1W1XG50_9CLOT|nr:SpoVR family protein [Clostridium acidisoli]SMC22764.1 stage V sporulation protein R [Clostridium acidisoli DSM 12555]